MKTIARIATRKGRENSLREAVNSLAEQVNKVIIVVNGEYFEPHIPLKYRSKVEILYPEGARDNPSDGWKFYNHAKEAANPENKDTYWLICDDDIRYPHDFAEVMAQKVDEYSRRAVVTCMGKIMKPAPIRSFYRDELEGFKTFEVIRHDQQVEIPGTCALAFHNSTCADLDHTFFKSVNSDIWMGVYCKQKSIPCYVIRHEAGWLTNLMPTLPPDTANVFDTYKNNDSHMTEIINTYWK